MAISINTVGGLMRPRGFNGQPSRLSENIIDSLVNSSATAVEFGALVGRDPANARCCRTALVGDELLGLSVRDAVPSPANSDGTVNYGQYRSVPIMRFGYINATPVENVKAGDGVVAIFTDGVFSGLGTTNGGISATRRLLNGHKWEMDCLANAAEPGEISVLGGTGVNYVIYA